MSNTTNQRQKQQEIIQRHLKDVEELPSLPAVLPKLLEVLDRKDSDAEDVSEVLRMDPALTAKVFRLINSAYYGLRRQINSVREAITYIGFNTVRNLALSAGALQGLSQEVAKRKEDPDFDWYELWEHSIATGIGAHTVGRFLRTPNNDNALAAGILHRLGLIVLHTHFDQLFQKVIEVHEQNDKDLFSTQADVLEFDEQDVGFWLAREWGFPESIASGIGYHERPLEYPAQREDIVIGEIPALVNLGKTLARKAGYDFTLDRKEAVYNSDVLEKVELTHKDMASLKEQFRSDIEDASAFMDMVEDMKDE